MKKQNFFITNENFIKANLLKKNKVINGWVEYFTEDPYKKKNYNYIGIEVLIRKAEDYLKVLNESNPPKQKKIKKFRKIKRKKITKEETNNICTYKQVN